MRKHKTATTYMIQNQKKLKIHPNKTSHTLLKKTNKTQMLYLLLLTH
jgi:hypothetical protein